MNFGPAELSLALALAALLVALATASYGAREPRAGERQRTVRRTWTWLTEPRHGVAASAVASVGMNVLFVVFVLQNSSVAPVLWPTLVLSDAVTLTRFSRGRALGRRPAR